MKIKIIPIICIYTIVISLILLATPYVPKENTLIWYITCLVMGIFMRKIVIRNFIK